MPDPSHHELTTRVLSAVSRSFYLTLRFLPAPMRPATSVGYLLARATDTLADAAALPPPIRGAMVRELVALLPGSDAERLRRADGIGREAAGACTDPGERALMLRLGEVVRLHDDLADDDRRAVGEVLGHIAAGQLFDLERFGAGPGGPADGLRFLESADELERYTFQVAGSVGAFWTGRCLAHLGDGFARLDGEAMSRLGVSYGRGLQLVNILRDVAADLRIGRCYLPRDEILAAGIDPADVGRRPEVLAPVAADWARRCRRGLRDGCDYVRALRAGRLRYATTLPVLLGVRTLDAVEAAGDAAFRERIKIPRSEVKRLMAATLGAVWSDRLLDRLAGARMAP